MPVPLPFRRERWIIIGVFWAALVIHFYFATFNWTVTFMPHQEFRQAQTAIVSYYIDLQNNFSWRYETPVVGKPWVSILLEVPIYEWSVVLLSRTVGCSQLVAARSISLGCFYLTLPAIYLLLGWLKLARNRRLLVLALILTAPLYIFYSRAFLMESMELLCCAWFLVGFFKTMEERRWTWLAASIVAGTGAALIKSATFAIWLLPGAAYGMWALWQDACVKKDWRRTLQTAGWGLGTVALPLAALRWWVILTDPIKIAHASAGLFASKELTQGNWGLLDFSASFSIKVWTILLGRWREAIMSPGLIGAILLVGLAAFPSSRKRVLGLVAVFFLAQLLFPYAYAYQEYYYYACTVFLLAAIGLLLDALLDSRMPKALVWLMVALPFGAQLSTYWHTYLPEQRLTRDGGFNYTEVLRDCVPRKTVIIVAGNDWCPIIPFYSQHRALMIRNGLERDAAYLHRAMDDLKGEEVSAIVLVGPLRDDQALLKLLADRFGIDASAPAMAEDFTDVYLGRAYVAEVQEHIRVDHARYPKIILPAQKARPTADLAPFTIDAAMARKSFGFVTPAPMKGRFKYGFSAMDVAGRLATLVNPECDLWLSPAAEATRIKWDFGIVPDAYLRKGDKTDGVEFVITGETRDGRRRAIFRRVLDPVNQPGDRGNQHADISYHPLPQEVLVFSNRPNLSESYDWAYWIKIEVK
ncbi:MAG: hypothetical protein ABI273_11070 [Lacunisphaera sp.]